MHLLNHPFVASCTVKWKVSCDNFFLSQFSALILCHSATTSVKALLLRCQIICVCLSRRVSSVLSGSHNKSLFVKKKCSDDNFLSIVVVIIVR